MKFRLPRLRFRLLSLMLGIALCSVVLASVANHQHRLRRQERAFVSITKHGGYVWKYGEGAYIFFQRDGTPWCGTGLEQTYESQTSVATFSDPQLSLLHDIIQPFSISFAGTQVSTAGKIRIRREIPNCSFNE